MKKSNAIEMLGGSVAEAARTLGVTVQAVNKWPEDLPLRIADRVRGAYARKTGVINGAEDVARLQPKATEEAGHA